MGSQDLQQARYDQLVRRVGSLYGGGSKVVEVLPELFPTLDVENLPLELILLAGWRKAMIHVSRTAGVGDTAAANLFNPVGSGVIAVVERMEWRFTATDNADIDIVQASLTGGQTKGLFRDSRLGGDRLSSLFATSQTAITTDAIFRRNTTINEIEFLTEDNGLFVLSPGNGVQLGQAAVTNKNISVTFFWRERVAEQSELNFP